VSPVLAAVLAAALAAAGWQARALTGPGALAASLVGASLLTGAGWAGAAALAAFFLSSSVVSRIDPPVRPAVGDPKGNRRDHWQVLANGGPAALGALLARDQPSLALWVATASLAAAGADTWATSVGAWSRAAPRHLLTWRPVRSGTNGGITLIGCLGALGGAGLVAGAGGLIGHQPKLIGVAAAIGFSGMLLDSALGASVQGAFRCPICAEPTEWQVHRCGTRTTRLGGLAWLDNDGVNVLATGFAALAGWCTWLWLVPGSP
jgi:uncharacterized protein (TIGR00297 family)